jgi:hypothetical protein
MRLSEALLNAGLVAAVERLEGAPDGTVEVVSGVALVKGKAMSAMEARIFEPQMEIPFRIEHRRSDMNFISMADPFPFLSPAKNGLQIS